MAVDEQLYSDIPPTKLRNKEEKFKPAKTNKFWLWVASMFFFNMLQNRFYAFRYKGAENYFQGDTSHPTRHVSPPSTWRSCMLLIVIGGMVLFFIILPTGFFTKKFV